MAKGDVYCGLGNTLDKLQSINNAPMLPTPSSDTKTLHLAANDRIMVETSCLTEEKKKHKEVEA